MSWRSKVIALLSLALLIPAAACSKSARDWREATQANTVQACEDFLDRHPESARKDEAAQAINGLTPECINVRSKGRLAFDTSFNSSVEYEPVSQRLAFIRAEDKKSFLLLPAPSVISDVRKSAATVEFAALEILPEADYQLEAIDFRKYFSEKSKGQARPALADVQEEVKRIFAAVKKYQSGFSAPMALVHTGAASSPEEESSYIETIGRLASMSLSDSSTLAMLVVVRVKQVPADPAAAGDAAGLVLVPYQVGLAGNLEFTGGLSRVSGNMDPSYTCFVEPPVVDGVIEKLQIGGIPIGLADGKIVKGVFRTQEFGEMRIEVPAEVECRGFPVVLKMTLSDFRRLRDRIKAAAPALAMEAWATPGTADA